MSHPLAHCRAGQTELGIHKGQGTYLLSHPTYLYRKPHGQRGGSLRVACERTEGHMFLSINVLLATPLRSDLDQVGS